MKRSILAFSFSLITIILHSQIYFNNSYPLGPTTYFDFSTSILTLDTGYIVYGQNNSYDYSIGRITLLRLNQFGEKEWLKEYDEPGVLYGTGYPKSLVFTNDNKYALAGITRSSYPGWTRDRGLLMKLDEDFDSLWIKTYGDIEDPCDTAVLFRQLINTKDGGYAILGGIMDFSIQRPHFYLIKTDSLGEKEFDHSYGNGLFHYFPHSLSKTSDNGFILGGSRWIDSTQSVDPVLYKTDSLGNEEWFQNLGSTYYDGAFLVDTLLDGNIIITTNISDSIIYPDYFYGRKYFAKMDNQGNIIWEYKYGTSYLNNYIWSIDVLLDGRIISTGSHLTLNPSGPERISWIFCINSDGDSLWYREYALSNEVHRINYLYDVVQANDSGFIACGYVWPAPTDGNWQDTWVIKVDSIGCESLEYCWTAIEKPEIKPAEKGRLVVFPNPANNHITIALEGESFQSGSQILIYNIYGIVTYCNTVLNDEKSCQINISLWPPGIYLARIVFMNEVVRSAKFIVN